MGNQFIYVVTHSYTGSYTSIRAIHSTREAAEAEIPKKKADYAGIHEHWGIQEFILDETSQERERRQQKLSNEINAAVGRVKQEIKEKHRAMWKENDDDRPTG